MAYVAESGDLVIPVYRAVRKSLRNDVVAPAEYYTNLVA